jgi:hypothetical protein
LVTSLAEHQQCVDTDGAPGYRVAAPVVVLGELVPQLVVLGPQ